MPSFGAGLVLLLPEVGEFHHLPEVKVSLPSVTLLVHPLLLNLEKK